MSGNLCLCPSVPCSFISSIRQMQMVNRILMTNRSQSFIKFWSQLDLDVFEPQTWIFTIWTIATTILQSLVTATN